MDIDAKDCRLDGFRGADDFYWLRATHLPTGVTVETRSSGGPEGRRLMEKLEASVKRHMNAEAEVPEEEPRCLVYSRLRASETRGSLISFQDARAKASPRECGVVSRRPDAAPGAATAPRRPRRARTSARSAWRRASGLHAGS